MNLAFFAWYKSGEPFPVNNAVSGGSGKSHVVLSVKVY